MSLFIKLFLAHLIGDFVLQSSHWIKDKQQNKLKSTYLYLHTGIHFILILLLSWDLTMWKIALLISISHLIIDTVKLYIIERVNHKQWPFFLDQLLHIIILALVAFNGNWHDLSLSFSRYFDWKIVTAFLFLSTPTSIIMEKCLASWNVEENAEISLPKAGKIIGILERFLILIFLLLNHWEAIGFLITAKSVFRFNDLKLADRKLTEYILIGTLLSFAIAIIIGILLQLTIFTS